MFKVPDNFKLDYPLTPEMDEIAKSGDVNLAHPYVRKAIANQIIRDIDRYAMNAYNDGHRTHLGASVIGDKCTRRTWYLWRWVKFPSFSGRQQRLFQRGHLEEARYEEYLIAIGCEIWLSDPTTGKQFRVSKANGHFGGSLDAIGRLPARYNIPHNLLLLGEFKTKATGSGFARLKEQGVMLTNPQHYDQMCVYGAEYGYKYAFYMSTNKNDDDMHVEIVPLNADRAKEIADKAAFIIDLQTAPPRVAENPTFYLCKSCDYSNICFNNHLPQKNCRSCRFARPVADAQWYCDGWNAIIPPDTIPKGCEQWSPVS